MQQFLRQREIYDFSTEDLREIKFKDFKERICFGKIKKKCKRVCPSGHDYELDKNGKPIFYIRYCKSPFCKDADCLRHRKKLAHMVFMMYFNAYDN